MSSAISPSGGFRHFRRRRGSALITSTGIGSGLDISAIVSSLTTAFGAAQTNAADDPANFARLPRCRPTARSPARSTPCRRRSRRWRIPANWRASTPRSPTRPSPRRPRPPMRCRDSTRCEVQNLATRRDPDLDSRCRARAPHRHRHPDDRGRRQLRPRSTSTRPTTRSPASPPPSIRPPNNPGVTASIITTTGGARLVLAGTTTGAANAITVTQSGGDGGLASLGVRSGQRHHESDADAGRAGRELLDQRLRRHQRQQRGEQRHHRRDPRSAAGARPPIRRRL